MLVWRIFSGLNALVGIFQLWKHDYTAAAIAMIGMIYALAFMIIIKLEEISGKLDENI